MCGPCLDKWIAWLSYRPVQPVQLITVGMSDPARVLHQQRARAAAGWRDVIRSQQALIARICAEHHQAARAEPCS